MFFSDFRVPVLCFRLFSYVCGENQNTLRLVSCAFAINLCTFS